MKVNVLARCTQLPNDLYRLDLSISMCAGTRKMGNYASEGGKPEEIRMVAYRGTDVQIVRFTIV